jgi:type I restriction enzyme, S subunit
MSYLSIPRLTEIAEFRSGGTPDRHNRNFYSGSIPWITGADISADGTVTPRSFIAEQEIVKSATCCAGVNDILLVSRTSVGKVTITKFPVCFSQDITAITPDTRIVNNRYLLHYLRSRTQYFTDRSRGATIKGVTRKVVEELEVPLMPLEEQQRIAQALDSVDALRAKRREAIALLDDLAQSIFFDMFDHPDQSWSRATVEDVVRDTKGAIRTGPFGSQLLHDEFVDSGVSVLGIDNAVTNEF